MIPAQRIIRTISEHWRVIELLVERYSGLSFSLQDVQNLMARRQPDWPSDKVYKEAFKLVQMEILIPQAKSSHLQLNQGLLEFAQYLMHEQQLGLAQEISLLIDNLKRLADKLDTALNLRDIDDTRRYCRQMDDRVRKIIKQFDNNENAIFNIVEAAKADISSLSLQKRYKAVIEAFDEYIEPMLEMVDINGGVKQTFDEIEIILSNAITRIEATGLLANEKELIIQLRSRILEMHGLSLASLRRCADLLMPLREELRKNTLLTQQVSEVLARMRKKGIEHTLQPAATHLSSDIQKSSLGSANQITAYMAELVDYQDEQVEIPDELEGEAQLLPTLPEFDFVLDQARQTKQIDNVLSWLQRHYQNVAPEELLYLYQKLANSDELNVAPSSEAQTIQIQDIKVTLHPYASQYQTRKLFRNQNDAN
ncbi:hypothetical protein C2869_19490 [Saccharobesus litoralis]|uniref:Uncharacterized protein n=1 Tax=Saccharobesus litoralis TaxID=2172099 RepID=A0A2S0VW58_9ALTE|nr:hypothetical protein [Saccharobesus litoralis]AWB68454.1 hypothetical protein C2869_19490 [Saccharobesus litoralis]